MKINPNIITTYQNEEVIKQIYKKEFNKSSEKIKIKPLSGGLKNEVYLIEDNNQKIVLKIEPENNDTLITIDKNIMWWEKEMLKLMEKLNIPSPKLLAFDDSCKICNAPYIFMSYIEGENYQKIKETLTKEEQEKIEYEIGQISHKISSIKSNNFFLPHSPNKKFNDNYEFISYLFQKLLNDGIKNNIDLSKDTYDEITNILESNKESLNDFENISLTNADIWDGNILIKDKKISGIVDFSDLYFCDELMTFYFHTIDGKTNEQFLKGYNNKELNNNEKIRIEIYRMYVILKMIIDCKLKEYGRFAWMYDNLDNRIEKIKKREVKI